MYVRRGLYQQLRDGENVLLIDGEGRGFALVGPGSLQRLFVRKRAVGFCTASCSRGVLPCCIKVRGRFGHEARGRPRLGALLKTPAHAASTKSTAGGLMAASGFAPTRRIPSMSAIGSSFEQMASDSRDAHPAVWRTRKIRRWQRTDTSYQWRAPQDSKLDVQARTVHHGPPEPFDRGLPSLVSELLRRRPPRVGCRVPPRPGRAAPAHRRGRDNLHLEHTPGVL